jgi:hypothetical protein
MFLEQLLYTHPNPGATAAQIKGALLIGYLLHHFQEKCATGGRLNVSGF